jgi:hypothetical protein
MEINAVSDIVVFYVLMLDKFGSNEDVVTGAARFNIMSAAFSAIIIVAAAVFAEGNVGITEASITRKLYTPRTLSSLLTTAAASEAGPMLHDPTK